MVQDMASGTINDLYHTDRIQRYYPGLLRVLEFQFWDTFIFLKLMDMEGQISPAGSHEQVRLCA